MKRVHVAIMKKSWGLLPKILTGEKTIESRWFKNKSRPWGQISSGDIIYFKNSGEPVTIKTSVEKVLAFENLNSTKVKEILNKYGQADGLGIKRGELGKYWEMFKNKNYCLLVFLQKPEKVKPFNINKKGFGAMTAWLITDKIEKIKKE